MNKSFLVHLFHIIIVGGLFLYVGINREKSPNVLFSILLVLGVLIVFHHLYKGYNHLKEGKSIWVQIIHIFIVAPIVIYIGYNKDKTQRFYFEILLMLGFASIGYHGYYLIQSLA